MKRSKKHKVSLGSESSDVNLDLPLLVKKKANRNKSSASQRNTNIPTPTGYSIHSVRWDFKLEGIPKRSPSSIAQMNNWKKRTWKSYTAGGTLKRGVTIVANVSTLIIWAYEPRKLNPKKLLYTAWNRVDLARRAFSEWQRVGISVITSEHPADAQKAHLVIETKKYNEVLKPQADKPNSARSGLIFDKSPGHIDKPEFVGAQSIEAVDGFDWLVLNLPTQIRSLAQTIHEIKQSQIVHSEAIEILIKKELKK